eukprot:7960672-Lingulodinium_polyedra.AAC.1
MVDGKPRKVDCPKYAPCEGEAFLDWVVPNFVRAPGFRFNALQVRVVVLTMAGGFFAEHGCG